MYGQKPEQNEKGTEKGAAFAPRRATMPVRGSLSVRPQFHNLSLELPLGLYTCLNIHTLNWRDSCVYIIYIAHYKIFEGSDNY